MTPIAPHSKILAVELSLLKPAMFFKNGRVSRSKIKFHMSTHRPKKFERRRNSYGVLYMSTYRHKKFELRRIPMT